MLVPALGAFYFASACGLDTPAEPSGDYDYVAVCTDPRTGERVEDDQCASAPDDFDGAPDGSGATTLLWFYMPAGANHTAPPVGQRVVSGAGSYATPESSVGAAPSVQRGGAPREGGPITRGGFGVAGKSGSGGS
ncbi:hypothetical protein CFP71_13440 [Amycolatopsis thailandensis]|uniref:Uncharacterized protein n=1 Tax=Amycolatopsis thailandensis TaxID=589330 RepID=A0A229SBY5_9PSEU|nr:hypothetical protein CFP71_13440 [Amycolatopsis thailandensis]